MNAKLRKGDRVRHATKTEWGMGEVLADPSSASIHILFEDAGLKEFDLAQAPLIRLDAVELQNDYLSQLVAYHRKEASTLAAGKKAGAKAAAPFVSFRDASQNFLTWFPKGFMDPAYVDGKRGERQYKQSAHELMVELLDEAHLAALMTAGDFAEISQRARSVVNATNLISPFEKMNFVDGLKDPARQELFARSLFDLLYGNASEEVRFQRFAGVLAEIGAASWPIATYFQFLRFPDRQMFMKPVVTQAAARVLHFELNYRSDLNWLSYSCLLQLAGHLRAKLETDGRPELKPRDLIDVQSFIWVTAPGYY